MDRCQWCGFLQTLMMHCLPFLGATLNPGSGHLLGVTHFVSGFVKLFGMNSSISLRPVLTSGIIIYLSLASNSVSLKHRSGDCCHGGSD